MLVRLLSSSSIALVWGLFAFGVTGPARAALIVDTVGSVGDVARSIAGLPAAESFTATGTGISNLEIELNRTAAASGSVVISLLSNNGNVPGSKIDGIYALPESDIPLGGETLFSFRDFGVNNLVNGSVYWIEVAKSGTVSTNVFLTDQTPAAGAGATEYWNGTITGSPPPLTTLCVSGDDACLTAHPTLAAFSFVGAPPGPPPPPQPTPEPASLGLMGVALGGLGVLRRRRRED